MALEMIRNLFNPFLDLIQIDVTTRGSRRGRLALRRSLNNQWIERDFGLEAMRALKPVLGRTKVCHLQGWGEPLLNPDFFELVRIAKDSGCTITTAMSDGSLINETTAREMIRSNLASITFSISALTDRENLERRGTSLSGVFQALEELKRHSPGYGQAAPQIHVLFNMHRQDLEALDKLPGIFQGLGVAALIVNPLTFAPGQDLEDETLVPGDEREFESVRQIIRGAAQKALKRDMHFLAFMVHGGKDPPRCIENLERSCFVDGSGAVSPCIFAAPPIKGPATYRFQGLDLPFFHIEFGNFLREPFNRIWNSEPYRGFRKQFKRKGVPDACAGCWRPYITAVEI